jgi:hypothetical protein
MDEDAISKLLGEESSDEDEDVHPSSLSHHITLEDILKEGSSDSDLDLDGDVGLDLNFDLDFPGIASRNFDHDGSLDANDRHYDVEDEGAAHHQQRPERLDLESSKALPPSPHGVSGVLSPSSSTASASSLLLRTILRDAYDEDMGPLQSPASMEVDRIIRSMDGVMIDERRGSASQQQANAQPSSPLSLAEARERRSLRVVRADAISPLQVKRRMRSSGSRSSVRIETLDQISRHLARNVAQAHQDSSGARAGVPTCLGLHPKFIAIGTSRGLILLFDHFQEIRHALGAHELQTAPDAGIACVDMASRGGDFLISCNMSGRIVLWDYIKGIILKAIPDLHAAHLTHLRLLVGSSGVTAVTADEAGVVNKVQFRRIMWSAWVADVECLLDGAAGPIPCLSVLDMPEGDGKGSMGSTKPPPSITSLSRGLQARFGSSSQQEPSIESSATSPSPAGVNSLLAMCNVKATFIVATQPQIKVVFKWPRPPVSSADTSTMSSARDQVSVCWSEVSHEDIEGEEGNAGFDCSFLARAWGHAVHLLYARFKGHECSFEPQELGRDFDVPVVALEWVTSEVLIVLGADMSARVCDARGLGELHQLPLDRLDLISQPKPGYSSTFRACDGGLYALGSTALVVVRISSWIQQVNALVAGGEWLEALAVALDYHESAAEPRRQEDASQSVNLLLRYVRLAIENAPRAPHPAREKLDLAKSHFQMLAGVCIEYCAVTGRLDVLFGEIFSRFSDVAQLPVFLNTLEPHVSTGRVKWMPSAALLALARYCIARGDPVAIERCVIALDKGKQIDPNEPKMDTHACVEILMRHGLYTGLLHCCSVGLGDYLSAFEVLLRVLMCMADSVHCEKGLTLADYPPDPAFESLGYKLLLYLRKCFEGEGFPVGFMAEGDVPAARAQLLYLLCQRVVCAAPLGGLVGASLGRASNEMTSSASNYLDKGEAERTIWKLAPYPYLRILLYMDPSTTLRVLSVVLDSPDVPFNDKRVSGSLSFEDKNMEEDRGMLAAVAVDMGFTTCPGRRFILSALASVLTPDLVEDASGLLSSFGEGLVFRGRNQQEWPLSCRGALLDFVSKYLELSLVQVPATLTDAVLHHVVSQSDDTTQSRLLALLHRVPMQSVDVASLLPLVTEARFFRAAVCLLRSSPLTQEKFDEVLGCHLLDTERKFQLQAFDFIRQEAPHLAALSGNPTAVALSRLSDLVQLDAPRAVHMVSELGCGHDVALRALEASPRTLFEYLDAAVHLRKEAESDASAGFGNEIQLTSEEQQQYLELLVLFRPRSVYEYLSTSDGYSLETCLELCRSHGVADATAYLLEKNGDVSGALDLTISSIDDKLLELNVALRTMDFNALAADVSPLCAIPSSSPSLILNHTPEGINLLQSVQVATQLCHNARKGLGTGGGSDQLWFATLGKLIRAKSNLLVSADEAGSKAMQTGILDILLQKVMDAMATQVALPTIVRKILEDHPTSSLGEFREVLIGVLDSCAYEGNIYSTSASLLFNDLLDLSRRRRRLAGMGVRIQLSDADVDTLRHAAGAGSISAAIEGELMVEALADDPDTAGDPLLWRRLETLRRKRATDVDRLQRFLDSAQESRTMKNTLRSHGSFSLSQGEKDGDVLLEPLKPSQSSQSSAIAWGRGLMPQRLAEVLKRGT